TLLLMAAAYLLGAIIACTTRRAIYRLSTPAGERRVDPLPEVAQAAAKGFGTAAAVARPASVAERAPTQPIVATPATAKPAATPATGEPQDLKRIRLIDPALEAALNQLGVVRYEQIAAWMRGDID